MRLLLLRRARSPWLSASTPYRRVEVRVENLWQKGVTATIATADSTAATDPSPSTQPNQVSMWKHPTALLRVTTTTSIHVFLWIKGAFLIPLLFGSSHFHLGSIPRALVSMLATISRSEAEKRGEIMRMKIVSENATFDGCQWSREKCSLFAGLCGYSAFSSRCSHVKASVDRWHMNDWMARWVSECVARVTWVEKTEFSFNTY